MNTPTDASTRRFGRHFQTHTCTFCCHDVTDLAEYLSHFCAAMQVQMLIRRDLRF